MISNDIQAKIDKLQKLIEDMPNEPLFVVETRLDGDERTLNGILNSAEEAKKFVYDCIRVLDATGAEQLEFITTEWIYEEKIGRYRSTENDTYVSKDGLEEWKGF